MKTADYLKYNGKVVRNNGRTYKIISVSLAGRVLVDAECIFGPEGEKGQCINLLTARTPVSKEIRSAINFNLVS